VRLNEIYEEYKARVDFYCVYIQEAHPRDGWQVMANINEDVIYDQPDSIEERAELAQACALRLNLKMAVLLDTMKNEVDKLYAALPERLYLLDEKGTVVFRTVIGSPGFDVEACRKAIRRRLAARGAA
jgi:Iodothyronine deiodinase